ncbi:SDR family NAD(P)-dependent oxidoreductase [Asticcacaulis sp. EMRT-3]|uniref:SDR family NAD(P)-dependent oxidoreductase n=1 Tax=Asticcacaulis sp. EMRT-3 TaxID=3040349 RepID=UPI0024AEE8FD|nr:SDR family NAD(P)-dependent oxidoreductase [Asticcacaulis sp. EMRT-3]MDI7773852.1 SDR family NAD(P)-dependent oxidoreductase [Asticcacaulis sp. EMRT-3]
MSRSALIFGYGFIGAAFAEQARAAGFAISATARTSDKRAALQAAGISAIDPADETALRTEAIKADAILITPAPNDDGCPAFASIGHAAGSQWIGYLSTTGVYGDRDGGWVFEDFARLPTSKEGARRVLAEDQWLSKDAHIFRLPGLYGSGRNVIERLRAGTARRIHKPGHVFSRLHHDDCATALLASLQRPEPGGIYNLCDDEPAPGDVVLDYAAALTGLPLPPQIIWDDPALSGPMQRFYRDNKRVANARAKAVLGWRLQYPTYREGLISLI